MSKNSKTQNQHRILHFHILQRRLNTSCGSSDAHRQESGSHVPASYVSLAECNPSPPHIPKSDTCTWPQIEDIDLSTTSMVLKTLYQCGSNFCHSLKNTHLPPQKLIWIPKTIVISCNFERCCVFYQVKTK